MPCSIDSDNDIRIGKYGISNQGMMKTIYRRGLSNRYGSMMQAIAGTIQLFLFNKFIEILSESNLKILKTIKTRPISKLLGILDVMDGYTFFYLDLSLYQQRIR